MLRGVGRSCSRLEPVAIGSEIDALGIELGADDTKDGFEAVRREWRDFAVALDRFENTAGAFDGGRRAGGPSRLEPPQIGDRADHAWPNSDLVILTDLDGDRPLEDRQVYLVAVAPPPRDADAPHDFMRPIGPVANRYDVRQARMDRHGPATQLLRPGPPGPWPRHIRVETGRKTRIVRKAQAHIEDIIMPSIGIDRRFEVRRPSLFVCDQTILLGGIHGDHDAVANGRGPVGIGEHLDPDPEVGIDGRRFDFLQTLDTEPNRTVVVERIEDNSRKAIQFVLMQHEMSIIGRLIVRNPLHDRLVEPDDLLQVTEHIHQRLDGRDEQAGLVSDCFDLFRTQLTQLVYSPAVNPPADLAVFFVILRRVTRGKTPPGSVPHGPQLAVGIPVIASCAKTCTSQVMCKLLVCVPPQWLQALLLSE